MTNADRVHSFVKKIYGDYVDFRALMDGSWFMGGSVYKEFQCTSHEFCGISRQYSTGYRMWNSQPNDQCSTLYPIN